MFISIYHWVFSNFVDSPIKCTWIHLHTFCSYSWHTMKVYRHDSMYFKKVDISWEISILKFPIENTFYAKICVITLDSNFQVTVHIYSDVTTLGQCNRIPLKYFEITNGEQWKYIHMALANLADSFLRHMFLGFRNIFYYLTSCGWKICFTYMLNALQQYY